MKNYLLLIVIVIVSCTKDEITVNNPVPSTELPPPSFNIPPLTNTTEPDFEYNGGDITISTKEDFLKYRGLIIEEVSGDFNITVDWIFLDGSSDDPSRLTENIELIEGDANIVTNREFSMENLVRVDGVYSVEGHDIKDDNLLYAKKIILDYEEDYEIKAVYTDEVSLNLGDDQTSKSASSSKGALRNVDVHAYHTSLLAITDFTTVNLPTIRTFEPPMPATEIYPTFKQTESNQYGVIESEFVKQIILGGHVKVNKIISNSMDVLEINNTYLESLIVESTSVKNISMPFLKTINDLTFNCSGVNEFNAPELLSISGTLTLSGISVVTIDKVTTIGTLTVTSGNKINLPSVETITTSTLPSNVRLSASSASGLSAGPTGGSSSVSSSGTSSSGTSSSSDGHTSGGSGHTSGGSGHTSGSSGG